MKANKVAFVVGCNGQDGSYLSELLLSKGYRVIGIIRRSSVNTTERIRHILSNPNFELVEGDVVDSASVSGMLTKYMPDEIYNLAAQSHVGTSFSQPVYSVLCNTIGTLNWLEAIRLIKPTTRFYQASTSEMFGDTKECPQNELTKLHGDSPYAIAKIAAHNFIDLYRKSYGIFACAGILFNHESVLKNSPVIIKDKNNTIDILPICDLFRRKQNRYEGLLNEYLDTYIWNGDSWTQILSGTCYRHIHKPTALIQTKSACVETTHTHSIFMEDNSDKLNVDIQIGDKLFNCTLPENIDKFTNDIEFCRFVGFVAGTGYVPKDGNTIRLTGSDINILRSYAKIIKERYGFVVKELNNGLSRYKNCLNDIFSLDIKCDSQFGKWLRSELYTARDFEKRIPKFILNATSDIKKAFFDGYCDACLSKNENETRPYEGWTTKSATLCLGLIYILKSFSDQAPQCTMSYIEGRRSYSVRLTSGCETNNEVVKLLETQSEDYWFFDLQTESRTFATGANLCKVHNSPRRGENFVTRKITKYIAKLIKAKQDGYEIPKLKLGNLDAQRDWGFAGDFVYGMWLMLQQDQPGDYVLATGITRTIREFLETAFGIVSLKWQDYVDVDSSCFRPSDVNLLCGDSTKARTKLGWMPKTTFETMVHDMLDNDLREEGVIFTDFSKFNNVIDWRVNLE